MELRKELNRRLDGFFYGYECPDGQTGCISTCRAPALAGMKQSLRVSAIASFVAMTAHGTLSCITGPGMKNDILKCTLNV
jgi:hypothetical protein